MSPWIAALTTLGTVVAMELTAYWLHRHVMHGWGWNWHRSHHEEHDHVLEKNDLYAVCFALVSVALFALGIVVPVLTWVALGMTIYGFLYFIVHDGMVHQRWPFGHIPRHGYLKRLYQAHKLHHAVRGREGAVSFGFLYAPPLERLTRNLRENRSALDQEGADRAERKRPLPRET